MRLRPSAGTSNDIGQALLSRGTKPDAVETSCFVRRVKRAGRSFGGTGRGRPAGRRVAAKARRGQSFITARGGGGGGPAAAPALKARKLGGAGERDRRAGHAGRPAGYAVQRRGDDRVFGPAQAHPDPLLRSGGRNTIGAGGGSIGHTAGGGLRAGGPRSAGAVPGPACYGAGGTSCARVQTGSAFGAFQPRKRAFAAETRETFRPPGLASERIGPQSAVARKPGNSLPGLKDR